MGLPGGSAVGRRGTGYRVQLRQTDWKDSVLRFCKFATGGGVGGGGEGASVTKIPHIFGYKYSYRHYFLLICTLTSKQRAQNMRL